MITKSKRKNPADNILDIFYNCVKFQQKVLHEKGYKNFKALIFTINNNQNTQNFLGFLKT